MTLIEALKQRPDLPIYAWVDGDIMGMDWGNWLGEFGQARVTKIISVGRKNCDYQILEYEDKDEIVDMIAGYEMYEDKTDDEVMAMIEEMPWREVILVNVGPPDTIHEYEVTLC